MRKSVKLLSLSVALLAGFGATAQAADDFKIGADLVSSYVWRGSDIGDSPAVQPALSYTIPGTNVVIGAWGSYAISKDNGFRYQEVDTYATLPVGPLSLTVTDYYVQYDGARAFDFSKDGPNNVEVSLSYLYNNFSLMGAVNVAANDIKNAKYFEAGYNFYSKDKLSAKVFVGAGDEREYAPSKGNGFNVVNVGLTVTKDRYSASYVINPDTEKSYLVFMASF